MDFFNEIAYYSPLFGRELEFEEEDASYSQYFATIYDLVNPFDSTMNFCM